jgi:hypothetical protein
MKRIFALSFLLLFATHLFAQKDVSIQLLSPAPGWRVKANESFTVSFSIKNVSGVSIAKTDTTLIVFALNGNILSFGGGTYFIFDHPILQPGDSIIQSINLSFSTTPPDLSVFCVGVLLRNVAFIDVNMNNNQSCLSGVNTAVAEYFSENEDALTIYPNPSMGRIFIKDNSNEYESADITDMEGKRIRRILNNQSEVDLSDLSQGIYLLCINDKNDKVIIRRRISIIK